MENVKPNAPAGPIDPKIMRTTQNLKLMLLQNRNGDLRINILRIRTGTQLWRRKRTSVHVGNAGTPSGVLLHGTSRLIDGHGGTDCRAGMIKEKCEMQVV